MLVCAFFKVLINSCGWNITWGCVQVQPAVAEILDSGEPSGQMIWMWVQNVRRFSNMALTFILRKFFDTYLSSLGDHIQGLSEYAITDEGKGKLKRFASALFSYWKADYSVIVALIKHVDDLFTCLQVMFCFIMR